MTKFLAKDYDSRDELLNDIRAKVGDNMDKNGDHVIEGKREDLYRLHLSDINQVYGIKCVVLDTPTTNKGQSMSELRKEVK